MSCIRCKSPDLEVLGCLGHRTVYRCRACGCEFSRQVFGERA